MIFATGRLSFEKGLTTFNMVTQFFRDFFMSSVVAFETFATSSIIIKSTS